MQTRKTIVGNVDPEVLAFTVGKDAVLDLALAEADCIGTAAHVTMLAALPLRPPLLSPAAARRVIRALKDILTEVRQGRFAITAADQDVHLTVERMLTQRLGDLGKRVHTARSRNDQVAVDLRLYAKEQLLCAMDEAIALAQALLAFARRHVSVPMVGRTHLQPAMPSSVGVWASAYAESLLDDLILFRAAYEVNDQCPLGSAAGYGVPLKIDRALTARLLGFRRPVHNVMHASNARGKCEAVILSALAQSMLTLSRLAEDLILYSMPEFGYFRLPAEYCTGSSIMPQKRNPDVLELVRAKSARVLAHAAAAAAIVSGLPGGYNRDLQEIKEPFVEAVRTTRACLRIVALLVRGLAVDRKALLAGFTPDVFATDRALELVAQGMPFRDAYDRVKTHLDELKAVDPRGAIARKTHLGAPAGLDLAGLSARLREAASFATRNRRAFQRAVARLLGERGSA
jgi:argininosuccinate lyase